MKTEQQVVGFVCRTSFDDLPPAVVSATKDQLLADLGTAAQLAETLAQRAGGNWTPYSCPSAADIRAEIAAGGTRWYGFGKEETKGGRTCRNTDETGPGDGAAGWATLRFFVPDLVKPTQLTMLIWGESASFSPVLKL